MYFFKSRLKNALRALLDPHYIPCVPFQKILERYGPDQIRNFIQIGSNDGIKNDPLRKNILAYHWNGIFVEPDFLNYQKLVQNYSGAQGLEFENSGIAEKNGTMTFHYIEGVNEKDPGWLNQVGSFDENTFLKNISFQPGLESRHKTKEIPVMTLESLVEKYRMPYLDLLHTDAEGYDYRILNGIDFSRLTPRVVMFESKWMKGPELKELLEKFRSSRYRIYRDGIDHIAYKA
jgi:FkbM family methyltransferase